MILTTKQLIGLPVVTESRQTMGKLLGLSMDADTGHLVHLIVRTRGLVPGLLHDELIVPWNRVVRITEQEVVVEDGIVSASSRAFASRAPQPASSDV